MHYCLVVFLFSWLTLGIAPVVWYHKISGRIGAELVRRGIDYEFGADDSVTYAVGETGTIDGISVTLNSVGLCH